MQVYSLEIIGDGDSYVFDEGDITNYSKGARIRTPANSDSVNSDKSKNLEEK